MSKYRVTIGFTSYKDIDVEASNKGEAEKKAYEIAKNNGFYEKDEEVAGNIFYDGVIETELID